MRSPEWPANAVVALTIVFSANPIPDSRWQAGRKERELDLTLLHPRCPNAQAPVSDRPDRSTGAK